MEGRADERRHQPTATEPQSGFKKLVGQVSSANAMSKNSESVQMVSEGGKMVPRIIPSVKQIEKTKPRRLTDSAFKPSEDSSSSAQSSAEKTGGRRGRSGGVGWRKDFDESEKKDSDPYVPGTRNDKFLTHGATNDSIFQKEVRSSGERVRDGLSSIVEEGTSRPGDAFKSVSADVDQSNADSVNGTSGKLVAVPKKASPDEPKAVPDRTSSHPRPPMNYNQLRKEIEELRAEMNELRAAKRSRVDSVDNARLQPLSSQPLNAQGLVSPTFTNNVSNNSRHHRKSMTESMNSENKSIYSTNSQIRDSKPTPTGNVGAPAQTLGIVRPNTNPKENPATANSDSKTTASRDPKYSFSTVAKQSSVTREFSNRAQNPNESVSSESKNNETKPKSIQEPNPSVGTNSQSFNQSLNRSSKWPSNALATQIPVDARRRKVAQRRANGNRNPNASDKGAGIAWKKKDQKPNEGCAQRALRRMMTARSSSLILLPFHIILVAFFVLYLMVGTLIIIMGSEGRVGAWHWAAVSGASEDNEDAPLSLHDPPGRAQVREEVLEKVMDIGVEAVLVRSRREVLKSIFHSPEMQAAFRAHQETGYQTLPSDDTLRALSDDITRRWRDDLAALLLRNDFIADLYTLGYQIPVKELFDYLSPYTPLPPAISWDHPSAILHAYTLVSTMGGGARTGGSIRGFVVAYAVFGVLLYFWAVRVWSRRITDTLVRLAHICAPPTREEGSQQREPRDHRARALALWCTLLLVLCVWLGLGPIAVGTPRASYGERLESATMALLVIRPPYPLPQTMESVAILIACVAGGHCVLLSLLGQISVACERWAQRWIRGTS